MTLDLASIAVRPAPDGATTLQACLDDAIATAAADGGWIALLGERGLELACAGGVLRDDLTLATPPWMARLERLVTDEREMAHLDDEAGSLLAVPLETADRVLGVLALIRRPPRPYSVDDVYHVTANGARIAAVIGSDPQALDWAPVERTQSLLEAAETINSCLDSSSLETTILAEATRLVAAQRSALLLSKGDVLVAQEALGFSEECRRLFVVPLEGSLFGRAVLSGDTVVVEDVGAGGLGAAVPHCQGECGAIMVAPLQSHRATFGALALFYDEPRRLGERRQGSDAHVRDPGRHRARQPTADAGEGPDGGA